MTNLLNTIMETYTIEYWQEHWNELITRVEEGSIIGVTDGKNNAECAYQNIKTELKYLKKIRKEYK